MSKLSPEERLKLLQSEPFHPQPPRPKTLAELIAAHEMLHNVQCGVDIGDGWVALVDTLCRRIEAHVALEELGEPVVGQVKEKFGGLRFYFDGPNDDYISGLITMAESMSYRICEDCGKPGEVRSGGWIRTLCDEHARPPARAAGEEAKRHLRRCDTCRDHIRNGRKMGVL